MEHNCIDVKIILTEYCNFDCSYCFYSNKITNNRIQIDYEYLTEYLTFLKKRVMVKNIVVTGGEPLLYSRIDSTLALFKSISENIMLLTNGSLISDENIALINESINHIDISLDDLYDAKKSHRSHVNETYDKLNYLKNKLDNNIEVGIAMSISKWNFMDILPMKEYCRDNSFNFKVNILQDVDDKFKELIEFSDLDIQRILEDLSQCDFSKTSLKLLKMTLEDKIIDIPCRLKHNSMVIFPNGDISFCYNRIMILGNIYTDDFENILSKYYKIQESNEICKFYRRNCFALY